ncbi:zf-HC2 domain-containing protein [Oscillibacter valericigenes]|nr:zf-HC2 domain-containing protein [Oscillibacter valericigenes]
MKKCEEFAPLLSAFVDGELTEEERAELRAHVMECEACQKLLGEMTALHEAFGALGEEEVPAGFTEGVMAAVRAEKAAAKPQTKKRSAWRRMAPLAACAALVLLAAAVALPQMDKKSVNDADMSPACAPENRKIYAVTGAPSADGDTGEDCPEQYCEEVQASPYYDYQLGGAAADEFRTANAPADLENGSSEPEYYCETAPIGESGREGKFLAADYGPPIFELYGAGATDYVLSSGGVKDGDAGFYCVPIAALRALPEGLGMTQAQTETLARAPADAEWVLVYPNDFSEVPQP